MASPQSTPAKKKDFFENLESLLAADLKKRVDTLSSINCQVEEYIQQSNISHLRFFEFVEQETGQKRSKTKKSEGSESSAKLFVSSWKKMDGTAAPTVPVAAYKYLYIVSFHEKEAEECVKKIDEQLKDSNISLDERPKHIPSKIYGNRSELLIPSYNNRFLKFIGREEEQRALDEFVDEDQAFSIWALVGPSGAGKTRLVIEWCNVNLQSKGWKWRFLDPKDMKMEWLENKPLNKTFLVMDSLFEDIATVQNIVEHCRELPDGNKVRLLIINRLLFNNIGDYFKNIKLRLFEKEGSVNGAGFQTNMQSLFFNNGEALKLDGAATENQNHIIDQIIRNLVAGTDIDESKIQEAKGYLWRLSGGEGEPDDPREKPGKAWHPLFAALVGDFLKNNPGQDFPRINCSQLIWDYLTENGRLPWLEGTPDGRLASAFIAAATARRRVEFSVLQDCVGEKSIEKLTRERFTEVKEICFRIVSQKNDGALASFEPDLLGENFFLLFLQFLRNSGNTPRFEFIKMLSKDLKPEDALAFVDFIKGLVQNLSNDDQDDEQIKVFWHTFFEFMEPKQFPENSLMRWAVSVALVETYELIKGTRGDAERFLTTVDVDALYDNRKPELIEISLLAAMIYFEGSAQRSSDWGKKLCELAKACEIEQQKTDKFTALMAAASMGNEAVVQLLLDKDANVNHAAERGQTALMAAASVGHEAVVQLLLDKDANVNHADNNGQTALMRAADNAHDVVVQRLLDKDANVNHADNNGQTALIFAVDNGHEAVVQLLLDKDANVNHADNNGQTALMRAADNAHDVVVQLLLDKDANVNHADNNGWTALMSAVVSGNEAVVQLLLDKDANVNHANNNGWTALIFAVDNGHEAVVQLLLDKDANVNHANNNGWTALIFAVDKDHEAVVQLLLDKDANVNHANNDGWTALIWAAVSGNEAVVRRLLAAKGVDINHVDNDGWTALMSAAVNGPEAVVQLLLDKDANVNHVDNDGRTALMLAAYNGHEAVVQLLLDKDANVNHADNNGWTALMRAAFNGHEEAVKILIAKDPDINKIDKYGNTALDYAKRVGHKSIIQLLIDSGAK